MALYPPAPEQLQSMKLKVNADPKEVKEHILTLTKWIDKHPEYEIREDFTTEEFLERFLIGCKLNVEKTIDTLEKYCRMRREEKTYFENMDPLDDSFTLSFKTAYLFTLPYLTDDSYRVSFCGLLNNDPNDFDVVTMVKRSLMHFDIRLQEDHSLGEIYVMDFNQFTLRHLTKFTYSFVKSSIECTIEAMPFRIKEFHFINATTIVGGLMNMIKLLLKPKLRKRIYVHYQDYQSVHKYIPKKILPSDMEGEGPTIRQLNDCWKEKVISYRDWFLNNK